MREFKAEITIAAPPRAVWKVLIDIAHWPEWDPNCIKVEGTLALGAKLKIRSRLSPKRVFTVKVTELVLNQKMVWTGGMPLGLFKGVRLFGLRETAGAAYGAAGPGSIGLAHGTQFVLHEIFSGPMLGLIGKSIPDMTEAFQKFCQGLKTRAEAAP